MNYPVWDIPIFGGGFLIAIIATVHVYISHFAVGGGLFLVVTEMKARRKNDGSILEYVRRHTKFFLLITNYDTSFCLWLGNRMGFFHRRDSFPPDLLLYFSEDEPKGSHYCRVDLFYSCLALAFYY